LFVAALTLRREELLTSETVVAGMQLAVFGATGRTGRPLVEQALAAGHEVRAFARNADDIQQTHDRLTVVEGDAYTGENVDRAVEGADAVVSVLGQSSDGPDRLLTVAGGHVLDAMETHGVERYVTLVGAGVRTPDDDVSLGGKVMGTALKLLAGEVLADAREHVDEVRASDTVWTVIRAPRLTEGPQTDDYRHGDLSLGLRDAISRADVADFALHCVEEDAYVRELPLVTG
jgi:putative NADH-flavin reductase